MDDILKPNTIRIRFNLFFDPPKIEYCFANFQLLLVFSSQSNLADFFQKDFSKGFSFLVEIRLQTVYSIFLLFMGFHQQNVDLIFPPIKLLEYAIPPAPPPTPPSRSRKILVTSPLAIFLKYSHLTLIFPENFQISGSS